MTCPCGSPIPFPRRQCDACRAAAHQKKLLSMRAPQAHCVDCDKPVSRKGQRCDVHLRIHKRRYLQEYRRVGPPEPQRPKISDSGISVTPEMRRACPLWKELPEIAANAPHLDWRTL